MSIVAPSQAVAPMSVDARADFEVFYRRDAASVYRSLSVTLGDAELGREATDEAMARAYQHWRRVAAYDNPAGWAYRVGLNWARSRLRKRRREVASLDAADPDPGAWPSAASPDSVFGLSVDRGLREALADLPLDSRAVVVLRYLFDWSTADVAEALGVVEGTVKSRLSRALDRLAESLEARP